MYRSHSLRTKKIEKDKQFVSGMRFIYNIIKHQAKQYNITDLIVPLSVYKYFPYAKDNINKSDKLDEKRGV